MSSQAAKSTEFKGRSAEMRDSLFLAVEDLEGKGDTTVTIARVIQHSNVTFVDGRKKDKVFAIEFERATKQLTVNATRRKTLKGMFGPDVTKWKGQQIILYIDPDVKMKGETVGGIRIRETGRRHAPPKSSTPDSPTDDLAARIRDMDTPDRSDDIRFDIESSGLPEFDQERLHQLLAARCQALAAPDHAGQDEFALKG